MWWNPFYDLKVNNDEISIINQFTSQKKFKIKVSDAIRFKKNILEPLMNENVSIDDFLKQFSEQVQINLQNLILQLENVILQNRKQYYFYQHLFTIIKQVSIDFPSLDTDRIVNYVKEKILFADAVVLTDNQHYSEQEISSIFPFKHMQIITIEKGLEDVVQQKIVNLREQDWIIFLINNLNSNINSDIVYRIESDIMKNNRTLLFIENNLSEDKVTFGPILIPRCTGGGKQVLQKKYLERIITLPKDIVTDNKESIERDMLPEYIYDEILKFTIDKYSNYATEYSKLLGTQYEIDYKEKTVKRREFIVAHDWL